MYHGSVDKAAGTLAWPIEDGHTYRGSNDFDIGQQVHRCICRPAGIVTRRDSQAHQLEQVLIITMDIRYNSRPTCTVNRIFFIYKIILNKVLVITWVSRYCIAVGQLALSPGGYSHTCWGKYWL